MNDETTSPATAEMPMPLNTHQHYFDSIATKLLASARLAREELEERMPHLLPELDARGFLQSPYSNHDHVDLWAVGFRAVRQIGKSRWVVRQINPTTIVVTSNLNYREDLLVRATEGIVTQGGCRWTADTQYRRDEVEANVVTARGCQSDLEVMDLWARRFRETLRYQVLSVFRERSSGDEYERILQYFIEVVAQRYVERILTHQVSGNELLPITLDLLKAAPGIHHGAGAVERAWREQVTVEEHMPALSHPLHRVQRVVIDEMLHQKASLHEVAAWSRMGGRVPELIVIN